MSTEEISPDNSAKAKVLSITIKDKAVLYAAYMAFIKSGGLFIPTNRAHTLGEKVTLSINLLTEVEKLTAKGSVCWITPVGAHGNRAPGIGVQFEEEEGKLVRDKIENYLAGMLKSGNPTHTF